MPIRVTLSMIRSICHGAHIMTMIKRIQLQLTKVQKIIFPSDKEMEWCERDLKEPLQQKKNKRQTEPALKELLPPWHPDRQDITRIKHFLEKPVVTVDHRFAPEQQSDILTYTRFLIVGNQSSGQYRIQVFQCIFQSQAETFALVSSTFYYLHCLELKPWPQL